MRAPTVAGRPTIFFLVSLLRHYYISAILVRSLLDLFMIVFILVVTAPAVPARFSVRTFGQPPSGAVPASATGILVIRKTNTSVITTNILGTVTPR